LDYSHTLANGVAGGCGPAKPSAAVSIAAFEQGACHALKDANRADTAFLAASGNESLRCTTKFRWHPIGISSSHGLKETAAIPFTHR